MPRFGIGQIVELLDAPVFLPGATLHTGDRGTIVAAARMTMFNTLEVKVLWHRNGRESWMIERRLRLYTYPMMNAPGRSQGAGGVGNPARIPGTRSDRLARILLPSPPVAPEEKG